jgi:hypothetical protein
MRRLPRAEPRSFPCGPFAGGNCNEFFRSLVTPAAEEQEGALLALWSFPGLCDQKWRRVYFRPTHIHSHTKVQGDGPDRSFLDTEAPPWIEECEHLEWPPRDVPAFDGVLQPHLPIHPLEAACLDAKDIELTGLWRARRRTRLRARSSRAWVARGVPISFVAAHNDRTQE